MENMVKCWEVFKCKEKECPVYVSGDYRCWLISETYCRGELQGKYLEKMESCLECEVFKANMDVPSVEETIKVISRQFKEYKTLVKERDKELEEIGLDLAIGLSKTFETLKRLSSGDPTARIEMTSENELLNRLGSQLNYSAENIEEMVNQSHELAIGLCEHYDALEKIAAGDRTARASETSENELVSKLGVLINKEATTLTGLVEDMETSSIELALGLSENFEVLRRVAEGDLSARAPEESGNEMLAKLGVVVNRTTSNLKKSWDDLEASKEELEEWSKTLEKRVEERTEDLAKAQNATLNMMDDLEKSKTYIENVVATFWDALIVANMDGTIRTLNQAGLDLLECNEEELIGKPIGEVFAEAPFNTVLEKSKVRNYETVYEKKDGRMIPMVFSGSVMLDKDDKPIGIVIVARDITDRKRAENEIRKLNEELEQRVIERTAQLEAANKELEAFSYSVSHDLRAPLRAIDGFSRMLLEDYSDKLDDEGNRLLNIVRSNIQKMGQLIDDLLAFSRIGRQDIKVAKFDMTTLVKELSEELIENEKGRDIQIKVGELPPAFADRAMMKYMISNLLSNAIKFTRNNGSTLIEVGGNGNDEDTENVYYVKDNGIGFDMQYRDKLFGVFQRLHSGEEFEGTGCGLALVQRIVHRHGGRIWAEGKVNEGAIFYFSIPKR